ncbi:hypothetical protein RV15_GL000589 [Enterococcus silesiacus]|nr:hypothetical protein RV15_GL000589 [Enterococcus silesiacus]
MTIIPRGDAKNDERKEQRSHTHTSFEPTGVFLPKDEEIIIYVDETPENLELYVGQWGNYTNVVGLTDGNLQFNSGKLKLKKGENRFTNTLTGGMVYLVNSSTTQTVHASLSKNINVPYFIQGETSIEEFKASLELFSDVPFMEFVNNDAIATIRMDRAKDIFLQGEQANRFMTYVSQAIQLENEAAGLDFNGSGITKKAQQRVHIANPTSGAGKFYCTDYFLAIHSATTGDREVFSSGDNMTNWGLFHEIGHSYQNMYYTWDDMGEVTVNIYSDHVQKHLTGNNSPYDAIMSPNNKNNKYREKVARYFTNLENDPLWDLNAEIAKYPTDFHFAALGMFVTLPRTFGYDFYPELNKLYRATPVSQLPVTSDEKKQFFIIMTSKIANRDLTPYFDFWHFKIDDDTKQTLANLHLPTLEKEIWKDILATEQEEKDGTYRISDRSYTLPYADLDSTIPVITTRFEDLNRFSLEKYFSNLHSEPIASPVHYLKSDIADPTNFSIQDGYAYFENDRLITNRLNVQTQIIPNNTYVMSGQNGSYAAIDYDPSTQELVAVGNLKQILQNIPNNIYPKVTVYSAQMTEKKLYAEGYGRDTGLAFANKLNKFKVAENDIIEIYHRESTKRVSRYINGTKVITNKDTYYYIITPSGWKELDFAPVVQWKQTEFPIAKTLTTDDFIASYTNPVNGDITFSFGATLPTQSIKQGQTLSSYLSQTISIKAQNSLFGGVGDYTIPFNYYFEDTIVIPRHGGYGTLLTFDKDNKKLIAQGSDPYTMNGSDPSTKPLLNMTVTYLNKEKTPTQIEVKNSTRANAFTKMINDQNITLETGDVIEITHARVNQEAISLDADSQQYVTKALTAFVEGEKHETFSGPTQYFLVTDKGLKLYENPDEIVGNVTVNYVDDQNTPIHKSDVLTGKIGATYATTPKDIEGYVLKETPENNTGIFNVNDQAVTYVYTKDGTLSLDFVPAISFGTHPISGKTMNITAEKLPEPAYYIQITDTRTAPGNWLLQVQQSQQFKTSNNDVLAGALFSISNIYAEKKTDGTKVPSVINSDFTLTFDEHDQGSNQNVLTAKSGEGSGTWRFYFNEQTSDTPSIHLFVPETANKTIGSFSSELLWTLSTIP